MILQKSTKESQQRVKSIIQADKVLSEWALMQTLFSRQYQKQQQQSYDDGLLDMDLLNFNSTQSNQDQQTKQQFFDSIIAVSIDNFTEDRILNFKCNYLTSKRKDQLFKKYKKQQQQIINVRKKQLEKCYNFRSEVSRGFKGEFTLKRGDQYHTCSITSDDLQKLRPETDLNDTIIANYIKFLQTEIFSQQIEKNIFIYSSFFFQKLVTTVFKQQPPCLTNQRQQKNLTERIKLVVTENYKNIKRWTRRVDIFQKQFLIIPINAFKHWYCVIVANPGSLIEMKQNKKPYIVYCDSMFEKRFYINDVIRMYLQIELEEKKNKKIEIDEDVLPCYQLLLPRQTNTHDCGLYMLAYIEHLMVNKHELQGLSNVKNREKLHIFPRSLIYSMRQRLKELFIKLIENNDDMVRSQIRRKYKEETEKIIKEADEERDIDKINLKEFKKYESINSHLLQNSNGAELTEEELEFACKVKFYLDPQINFYERDRF